MRIGTRTAECRPLARLICGAWGLSPFQPRNYILVSPPAVWTIQGGHGVTNQAAGLAPEIFRVWALKSTIVVRLGPYFIFLATYMGLQEYEVWARSDHYCGF